jgi:rRNA maturation protein Nop10
MAINLSNLITTGSGSGTNVYEFHALKRSSDGMLIYTLEDTVSNTVINVFNEPVNGVFAPFNEDYTDSLPANRQRNNINDMGDLNSANDKYQQYRFENKKVRYFIDDDGYIVARLNANYSYTGPK